MAGWSPTAEVAAPHAPRPRTAPRRRAAPRPRVAGGVLWIVAVALLLAGVVAMNVAVLRLNVRLDGLTVERAKLRAENAALASQLSSAAASPLIQQLAATRLGLVPAQPAATTYVTLGRRGR